MNKFNPIKREKEKRIFVQNWEFQESLSLSKFGLSLSLRGDGRIFGVKRTGEILILTSLYIDLSNVRMGNLLIQNRQVIFQVSRQGFPFTKWQGKIRHSLSFPLSRIFHNEMARVSLFGKSRARFPKHHVIRHVIKNVKNWLSPNIVNMDIKVHLFLSTTQIWYSSFQITSPRPNGPIWTKLRWNDFNFPKKYLNHFDIVSLH